MGPREPAPGQQVLGLTCHAEEEEERGPLGTRAGDAGARRSRVSSPAGAVSLASCKFYLVSVRLGEGLPGVNMGVLGGLS